MPPSRIRLRSLLLLLLGACGEEEPPAPTADVELVVDRLGITHVYAKSDGDAFFGGGYAMARDRLFQMELARRRALGTSAELLGAAALHDDQASRTFGFGRLGAADAARLRRERPGDVALFEAWAAGVNRRIAEVRRGAAPRPYGLGPSELDFVPAPWTVEDALAIGKLLAFGLSNNLDQDLLSTALRNLSPAIAQHLPYLMPAYGTFIVGGVKPGPVPPAPPAPPWGPLPGPPLRPEPYRLFAADNGSNNWAVDGAHSQNGRPLLCGDPHQVMTSPSRVWPVHLASAGAGGTLDVIGFAFPGTPSVELGHNAHLGWTATTDFADVMDLWDVAVGRDGVALGGEVHPSTTRREVIRVRRAGARVGQSDEVALDVVEVPGYGVLLPDELLPLPRYVVAKGQLLFNWTGFRATRDASSYLALDHARDLDEFERAVDLAEVGAVNFVAADRTGIDYRVHALVPDRGDPSTHPMPWHVLAGDDPKGLWTRGELPAARLPHLRAPERGFLVSANNDPFGFTADGSVENDPYYYGAFYANGMRAHRIEESLTALTDGGKKVSRDDMERLQADVRSPMADTLLPHLATAMAALASDPKLKEWAGRKELAPLAARLAAWDRRMAREAPEPVVFLGLEWFAARRALGSHLNAQLFDAVATKSPPFLLGALRNVVERRFPDADFFLPDGRSALLVGALADTADWLTARFGTTDLAAFRLADLQQAAFPSGYGGALDGGRVAVSGSSDTVLVAEGAFFAGGKAQKDVTPVTMSVYRMALSFAADGTPEATIDFARGSREDPTDPHFADQQAAWVEGSHTPLPYRRAEVDAAAAERITLPAHR